MGDRSALTVTIHAAEPAALATIHDLFEEYGLGEFGGPYIDNPDYPAKSQYRCIDPEAPNGEKIALGYAYGASETNLSSAEEVASALAAFPGVVAEAQQDPRYEISGYTMLVANGRAKEVAAESEGQRYVTVESLNAIITDGVLDYDAYRKLIGADYTDAITATKAARIAEHGETVTWLPLPAEDDAA